MTRRPDRAERVVQSTAAYAINGLQQRASRSQRGLPRPDRGDRVGVDMAAATGDQLANGRHVVGRVYQLESCQIGWRRFPNSESVPGSGRAQVVNNRHQTVRSLGVTGACLVAEKRLGVSEAGGYEVLEAAPGDSRGTG